MKIDFIGTKGQVMNCQGPVWAACLAQAQLPFLMAFLGAADKSFCLLLCQPVSETQLALDGGESGAPRRSYKPGNE